jgi:hypothetical protein
MRNQISLALRVYAVGVLLHMAFLLLTATRDPGVFMVLFTGPLTAIMAWRIANRWDEAPVPEARSPRAETAGTAPVGDAFAPPKEDPLPRREHVHGAPSGILPPAGMDPIAHLTFQGPSLEELAPRSEFEPDGDHVRRED